MSEQTAWLPQIDRTICTGCGDCITNCLTSALGWQNSKASLINPNVCLYEAKCEEICPVGAITLPFLIKRVHSKNEGLNE